MSFIPSPPHQYSNHMFTNNELCQLPSPAIVSDGVAAARGGCFDSVNVGLLNMMPLMDATTISSSTLPHQYHHNLSSLGDMSADQPAAAMLMSSPPPCGGGYGCGYDRKLFESVDECNGLLGSSFWSLYPASMRPTSSYAIIEGIQGEGSDSPKVKEQPAMKIGRYSEEERKDRILRYLKKRNQRNFNKTIKYACRKTLADKRVRVRGRFAKNNEIYCGDDDDLIKSASNQDNNINKNNIINNQTRDLYYDHRHPFPFQTTTKHDEEEEWLEEAITSLMYIGAASYDITQYINFS